jgi:uncharacterized membrane protein
MLIWGAIWGAILGFIWPGYDDFQPVLGAILGFLAGLTFRRAVRAEIAKQKAAQDLAAQADQIVRGRQLDALAAANEAAAAKAAVAAVPASEPQPEVPWMLEEEARAAGLADTPPAAPATPPTAAPPARPPTAPAAPREPNLIAVLVGKARDWLFGGNTIVRVGVLVLFVGLAFLAKYAIDRSLVPPELRLAAIALAGIGLFGGGFWLRMRRPERLPYALTLQGAGVAVLYLTVFAAFRLYQFITPGAAFALLAVVCAFSAVIALAQNAMAMAFIGFAGGFAAPLLVSTGSGNHVALFSYYLLLSVAIAVIAWYKAWRPLNLLGFFATFGVATVWGVLKYRPANFETTEPFLIAFFLVYVAASLMYALRHSLSAKRAVDATLIFGTPLVAFGLQAGLVRQFEYATAFSSLAMGAFYLALGWWALRRRGGDAQVNRWLAECFAALGVGFLTLAVPLALDARWTSAVWAVEGAAVYWMGRRQDRWLARGTGLALQVIGGLAYLAGSGIHRSGAWPLANPAFIGAVMLAGSAIAIAWWARKESAMAPEGRLARAVAWFERGLSAPLFLVGFLWWLLALSQEITRHTLDANQLWQPVFGYDLQAQLHLLAFVASAFIAHHAALPSRREPWPVAAWPAMAVLPVMLWAAIAGMDRQDHVFQSFGWLVWPVCLAMHFIMLRRLDAGTPRPWWPWVHAGGVWLAVLLAGNFLVFAIGRAELWQTAWATVILLVAATLVLLVLSLPKWFSAAQSGTARWPLDRFALSYLWYAAAPLAVFVALGALVVALFSDGNAKPLPYIPLLNPTDLSIALALAACVMWLMRLRASTLAVPRLARHPRLPLAPAFIGFIAINTVWLRVVHHFAGVPWDADDLSSSFLVQAGFSILWTVLALGMMVVANKRAHRGAWMTGAALLGLTVAKLFLVDLSNRGGSERIIVFIAVGLLMLVIGYFAPMPPSKTEAKPAGEALT